MSLKEGQPQTGCNFARGVRCQLIDDTCPGRCDVYEVVSQAAKSPGHDKDAASARADARLRLDKDETPWWVK